MNTGCRGQRVPLILWSTGALWSKKQRKKKVKSAPLSVSLSGSAVFLDLLDINAAVLAVSVEIWLAQLRNTTAVLVEIWLAQMRNTAVHQQRAYNSKILMTISMLINEVPSCLSCSFFPAFSVTFHTRFTTLHALTIYQVHLSDNFSFSPARFKTSAKVVWGQCLLCMFGGMWLCEH